MAYDVRPLRLEAHRDALAELWRDNMSDARIAEVVPQRMRWLYEQNPAGPALTWVGVVAGSEQPIGCATIIPRRTQVAGRMVNAGVFADFAVTKGHRTAGAAIAIQRAVANNSHGAGVDFLYGSPNDKAVAIFKRLGYRFVGESSFWVKPLRSAYKIRQRVANPVVVRGASAIADVGLRAVDRALSVVYAAGRRARGAHRSFDVVDLDRADERFDELWERARSSYRVVGEKTAAYLNWRYAEFTTRKHRFSCLVDRETKRLRGYAVYKVEDGAASVEDAFCEDLGDTPRILLLELARRLRRAGASSLVFCYLGPEGFAEQLRSVGFLRRPGARSMIAYVDPKGAEDVRREVFDRDAWFLIDGELDI